MHLLTGTAPRTNVSNSPPGPGPGKKRRPAWRRATEGTGQGPRGQALVEFAIVLPVFMLIIAGIIQFGLIFWSQNTLTQVARDTGRWAATQLDCSAPGAVTAVANNIAGNSSLFGYSSAAPWTASGADTASQNEVVVAWTNLANCPPPDNQDVAFVTVQIDHQIPVFFPFVPGGGNLSTSAEFRMEPEPQ